MDNHKSGGCEKTIRSILLGIDGMTSVAADLEKGEVHIMYDDNVTTLPLAISRLAKAGYPPIGESDPRDKAKSYNSCMKGRISN